MLKTDNFQDLHQGNATEDFYLQNRKVMAFFTFKNIWIILLHKHLQFFEIPKEPSVIQIVPSACTPNMTKDMFLTSSKCHCLLSMLRPSRNYTEEALFQNLNLA